MQQKCTMDNPSPLAVLDEELHHLEMTFGARHAQGTVAVAVLGAHECPVRQQQPGHRQLVLHARPEERRLRVARLPREDIPHSARGLQHPRHHVQMILHHRAEERRRAVLFPGLANACAAGGQELRTPEVAKGNSQVERGDALRACECTMDRKK